MSMARIYGNKAFVGMGCCNEISIVHFLGLNNFLSSKPVSEKTSVFREVTWWRLTIKSCWSEMLTYSLFQLLLIRRCLPKLCECFMCAEFASSTIPVFFFHFICNLEWLLSDLLVFCWLWWKTVMQIRLVAFTVKFFLKPTVNFSVTVNRNVN